MDKLIGYLDSIYPLPLELREHLQNTLQEKKLIRKQILLSAGETCRHIYFIDEGLLRCYYKKGKREICSWFMKQGDIVASIESFFDQSPSYENIQALEDCRLYYISYEQLQYIYKQYPEFNTHGRVLTEQYYRLWTQQLYSLRMHRAAERYDWGMENYPDLFQRVSARQLSSWLGITEVTLSVLRCRK